MRKQIGILVIVICIASTGIRLNGQEKKNIRFGVKSGLTISKANFNSLGTNLNYRLGYYLGAYWDFSLNNDLLINGELLYITKGWNLPDDQDNKNVSITLNYLEVPLVLEYSVSKKVKLLFGPGIGFKVGSKRRPESSWKDNFEDITFSLVGGAEYSVSSNIGIELRYTQGIKSLYSGEDFNEYEIAIENSSLKDDYMHSLELGVEYLF